MAMGWHVIIIISHLNSSCSWVPVHKKIFQMIISGSPVKQLSNESYEQLDTAVYLCFFGSERVNTITA